ncbi:lasso peptide biosynthesis B2 protein [Amycolatopsis sp. EV170708-02-1]|uniref:lasso peptide biosynthesis B2 protein n=1 Tax=Amycolatopsis sp. EV170708-02-1 TaxID=2919322 RepID=UPI001F0B7ABB|nr:lasso peptide biosynthesis B2 protein [Amycolatopsis sp. EV170708-02-1]UMP06893.1 lasso peptide biosynthesis B2 protein [Amycolatopsis sp. EV170708-02-1]
MNHPYLTAAAHVRAVDVGPATVIVNYRGDHAETLIGPAARWWAELAVTGDAEKTAALDTASAQTLREQLLAAGLLKPTARPKPWPTPTVGPEWVPSWGTHELTAGRPEPVPVPLTTTVFAGVALAIVLATLTAGHRRRRLARLTRLLNRVSHRAKRPATIEHARRAVHAVRRAGLLAPGRVACLEESAAVLVLLAASRQRVMWCHGAAADPVRLHAWVETDDRQPVAEPPSTARFAVLNTIPARDDGGESD